MNFTVYKKSTGQILRNGYCPDDQFSLQAQGDDIVEGLYPDDQFYWDDGFQPKPSKPDGFYDFDYTTKAWVLNQDQTIGTNKSKRNSLLISSDWTQLPDVALSAEVKTAWSVYRQQLRDMTDFISGTFPIPPQ